jgi:2-polyprenyl-6-methoxyphenol hydroxylase-like FAD-dependent oxidoreductase
MTRAEVDVLIVGAGPTGLALAAHLANHGVQSRVIDCGLDRTHESRALAIQPRTLEALAGPGVTDHLVAAGNRTVKLRLHTRCRHVAIPMFDLGLDDTAYPYLLFLSQAETERILAEHLDTVGVPVERGVELVNLTGTVFSEAVVAVTGRWPRCATATAGRRRWPPATLSAATGCAAPYAAWPASRSRAAPTRRRSS